jgi:hypothetical protein
MRDGAAEDAFATAEAIGGCPMFRGAFLRLTRADALHATGALDAARGAIADARARLLAIARTIEDPAYRTGFLEAVPRERPDLRARTRAALHGCPPGAPACMKWLTPQNDPPFVNRRRVRGPTAV